MDYKTCAWYIYEYFSRGGLQTFMFRKRGHLVLGKLFDFWKTWTPLMLFCKAIKCGTNVQGIKWSNPSRTFDSWNFLKLIIYLSFVLHFFKGNQKTRNQWSPANPEISFSLNHHCFFKSCANPNNVQQCFPSIWNK